MAHAHKVKYLKSEDDGDHDDEGNVPCKDDGDHDDEGNVPCKNLHVFSPCLTASKPRRSHLCRAFWDLKGKHRRNSCFSLLCQTRNQNLPVLLDIILGESLQKSGKIQKCLM